MGRALAKEHVRVVGVDDGPFHRGADRALVALVVCSLPQRVDGVAFTDVSVDGSDATRRIAAALLRSPHLDGLRAVLLDGATVGGFNVVDLAALSRSVARPVVAVTPRRPDFAAIDSALRTYFPGDRGRRRRLLRSRPLFPVRLPGGTVFAAVAGATRAEASQLVRRATLEGLRAEPLRLARLLARGAAGVRDPDRPARSVRPGPRARPVGRTRRARAFPAAPKN
ncbi:MAG: DUF99 family protein [Thermoplasmata archaeon]|nr:DUF99 family protein [Thermoplasmata archaeon]